MILNNLRKQGTDVEVYCSGGMFKKDTNCLVGYNTINFFKSIKVDKAFISIGALNEDKIFSIASQDELEVKKSIIESSNKIIALSDSSKFDSTLLYEVGSIDLLDILVTDKDIAPELLDFITRAGVEIYTV
jgi:DeoR/GlpR family transcriptional regulator of sugar metabolism